MPARPGVDLITTVQVHAVNVGWQSFCNTPASILQGRPYTKCGMLSNESLSETQPHLKSENHDSEGDKTMNAWIVIAALPAVFSTVFGVCACMLSSRRSRSLESLNSDARSEVPASPAPALSPAIIPVYE